MKELVIIWALFSAPDASDNSLENYSEFEESFLSEMECLEIAKELNSDAIAKGNETYFYCVKGE